MSDAIDPFGLPAPGSFWLHYNGNVYTVLHVANEPDDERYPRMIVYRGVNGKVWARRAADWHRSMTLVPQPVTEDVTETLIPTHGFRWHNGTLEQMFLTLGGRDRWKPIPVVGDIASTTLTVDGN